MIQGLTEFQLLFCFVFSIKSDSGILREIIFCDFGGSLLDKLQYLLLSAFVMLSCASWSKIAYTLDQET